MPATSVTPEIPFREYRLANGLRLVLHRDRTLPLVAINLWYHVGSRHELPGRTGLAHLFEHMLFQGSEHVGTNDHFRYVQQVGGVANGSTWYDRTNYHETLPAQHLDLGLWLESDRMGFLLPALTQEKLDNQRDVVMNERRQRVDNQPYGRAFERLHELLYAPGHPYRWPVIGSMEDIAAATLDEVRDFFRVYYSPDNAVLTLAGDFDLSEAQDRVEAWFGDLATGPVRPVLATPPAAIEGERRDEISDRVQLPRVYLAWEGPSYGTDAWYAGSLLCVALGSGKSSPLYSDLVLGRQLAKDVSAFIFPTELGATTAIVATARPGVSAADLEHALDEHIERAAAAELPGPDFERARNQLLRSAFAGIETVESKAEQLSQFATYFGNPGFLQRELSAYAETSPEAARQFAKRYWRRDRRTALTVVPETRP
ncbi:MAG: pitrilysin family protein [Acidobacteriota bacterium]